MSTALHPAPSPDASGSSGSSGVAAPEPPRRRAIGGRAPARPTAAAAIHSISAATAVLLWLVAIGAMIHEPILIPPLAASAALVHSAPTLPLAQPRGVVIGHMVGAAVGYGVLAAAGSSAWGAAVAAGVTLALVMVARTPHSPACATAVVVVLQAPVAARFVPLLFGSTVLIVLTGYAASRVRRKAPRYPAYWW
ncbi:HPP family protein [Streptomyces sp. NPDC002812]|uniref:HPP family protein n=1 Tax=unclassified Streptomyces TaxID=2593676 RepID=UPI00202DF3F5|nr:MULTISPECIES: HPP family protein [unclassified Streptomyces]MCM1972287.1 HPP family protein [Streptomyces sp. G1]MCX5128374.1 HPP family protein [Streptomyces sp. NBC_00347]MCX5300746.1 HPP family protein [Streptomyces sp. NBC_00193]